MHASCGRLRERGFINYFGTQRLGNPLVPGQLRSYHVGRALLRSVGEASLPYRNTLARIAY